MIVGSHFYVTSSSACLKRNFKSLKLGREAGSFIQQVFIICKIISHYAICSVLRVVQCIHLPDYKESLYIILFGVAEYHLLTLITNP